MVEQHVLTNLSDALVGPLSFSHGNSAEYVSAAKQVRFFAEASDRFSQNSKVIRFRLIDDCWLQSGSVRMQVTLNNLKTDAELTPVAHPACVFSSCRLFLGGQVVEQIDDNQVLATLLDRFKPSWRQITDSMENHPIDPSNGSRTQVRRSQSRRLIFELPFGLLKQEKWLPLHIISQLVLELTLGPADQAFAEANASWDLSDVSLLATCLHVDSSITAQYHQHIDSGNALAIPFTSAILTRHIVNSTDFTLSLSRSLSRLKQIYFVMVPTGQKSATQHVQVVTAAQLDLHTDKMSFQYQIGASRFPDTACIGAAEAYHRLKQAVGTAYSHEDLSIVPSKFMANEAVFGIDLEKAGDAALFTGISTREGKVMLLTVKNGPAKADAVHEVFVCQVFDGIVNIRRGAVDVGE